MNNNEYVRLKLRINKGIRYYWALKVGKGLYHRANKAGETIPHSTLNIIIAHERDILWEKPALINLKYNELELV